jgi:dolichol-phosphate mannosyltransferase
MESATFDIADQPDLVYPSAREPVCILSIVVPTLNERRNVAPLVRAIDRTLGAEGWEVIFVDDDSSDGTAEEAKSLAQRDARVRCIHRIGRRGLSSAVTEGVLSSSAEYVAVIDGDLQHDEALLKTMLHSLTAGQSDIVVASRFMTQGNASGLDGAHRRMKSQIGNSLARSVLKTAITDPMSGFFMMRRRLFEKYASKLSGQGFKILLDLLSTVRDPLRVTELPMTFRPRINGASKLDFSVELAFASMLVDKTVGRFIPLRFLAFCMVGGTGVLAHLTVLKLALTAGLPFAEAQGLGGFFAMTSNFWLNNLTTYRDRRLRGWNFLTGLLCFYAVCSIGFICNVGVGNALFSQHSPWWLAGILGAAVGAVWNYSVSSVITWRER